MFNTKERKHLIRLIYLNSQYVNVNENILKKLREGDLSLHTGLITLVIYFYYLMNLLGVDAFAPLQDIAKKYNALSPNPQDSLLF